MGHRDPPPPLRWLARLLVRGKHARFIRADLNEAFAQDISRGIPFPRAILRYLGDVLVSGIRIIAAQLSGRPPRVSWLDVKLGFRMLAKHPGLNLIAGFALAIGIPVGLAPSHVARAIKAPLPIEDGHRVQAIRYWDVVSTNTVPPSSYDLDLWEGELTAFESLGAVRMGFNNLGDDSGAAGPIQSAEVTASTFDILRVSPILGRTLTAMDEGPSGQAVAVIGYDLWQSRFGGDPGTVGRTIRIADVPYTVVGIMPEGFSFPASQQVWLPLRRGRAIDPSEGPAYTTYGRLAEGASVSEAQAQLTALDARSREAFPNAYMGLQPEIVPFGLAVTGIPRRGLGAVVEFYGIQALAFFLLAVASANVAILVFAQTATRFRELSIRTALGATRARVISQIFIESLVLAVLSVVAGLALIDWVLGRIAVVSVARTGTALPYWLDIGLTVESALWGIGIAVASAAVASVLPALTVTGARVQQNIQRSGASRSGIRFGRVTGALIAIDVAIAIASLGTAVGFLDQILDARTPENVVGIRAEEYLALEVRMPLLDQGGDGASSESQNRVADLQTTLIERIRAEPGVRDVAAASSLPRMDHVTRRVEVENNGIHYARMASVAPGYFDAFGQSMLSGRGFDQGDFEAGSTAVIVNAGLVDRVFGGRNPVGERLRLLPPGEDSAEGSPWREIVGVVGSLGMDLVSPEGGHGFYLPAPPGTFNPIRFAIHMSTDPGSFSAQAREIVTQVDPAAVLIRNPLPLDQVFPSDWYLMLLLVAGLALLVGVLVTLAVSGIYAIVSFAVSERTREIGIRNALGARRRMIGMAVLRRSLVQIGTGVLLGVPLGASLITMFDVGFGRGLLLSLVIGVGVASMVGLLACTAPTLRALRIEPTEALRADA